MKFVVADVKDGLVTLAVPGTNYRNTFKLAGSTSLPASGEPVRGTVLAPARKAELVSQGGNYVEPLLGRPRRMQGTVLAQNVAANELTVKVGYEVVVKLPAHQKAEEFPIGSRVGWDNADQPVFQPVS